MITRYNLMKSSTQFDIDNEAFPDPLSLNYKKILESDIFSDPPLQTEADYSFLERPYLLIWNYYNNSKDAIKTIDDKGQAYLDDIILDLNNIPHIDSMEANDPLYIPTGSNLNTFINTYSNSRS